MHTEKELPEMTERSQRILSSSVVKCSGLDLSTPAASGMVTAEAAPQHRYALQQDDLVRKRFGGNGAKPPPPSAGRLVRGRSESSHEVSVGFGARAQSLLFFFPEEGLLREAIQLSMISLSHRSLSLLGEASLALR